MLSVIIPSRTGQYLQKTVDDLFEKAVEEIEVIVVLDGYVQDLILRPNLKIIQGGLPSVGRNLGALEAEGEILLFLDSNISNMVPIKAHKLASKNVTFPKSKVISVFLIFL
jgi:glycosyltransferase involved in cell wall biosynthesis